MGVFSGQKVVAAAGTEVALGSQVINGPVLVKALSTNGGLVFVGNVDGVVSSANGFHLAANQEVRFKNVTNLSQILVDAAVNGEGVSWLALEV